MILYLITFHVLSAHLCALTLLWFFDYALDLTSSLLKTRFVPYINCFYLDTIKLFSSSYGH